jgi:ABC-2 type transport system permease protein
MKTFKTMLKIEGRLSIRDMNMVVFAIVMPIIVLVILGIIYGDKPAFDGASYTFLEQSFGALCSIAICAGGLMGLPLLVSEYRERKILKRFQVTLISPALILVVHLCIYVLYSIISVLLLWVIAKMLWGFQMKGSVLLFFGGWLLVLVSILSLGMLVGGIAKNSKIASIIACILYFPMLVFSGATLPYEVMPNIMKKVVDVMPLTQGIKILKATTLGQPMENVSIAIVTMLVLAIVCTFLSVRFFRWE